MTRYSLSWSRLGLLPGILLLTLAADFAVAEPFTPPKLDGFELHHERDVDGDENGEKETHIRQYFNTAGDSIFSMTTKGRVWAWSLNTRGTETGDKNYVIRDSDCDGLFDEVYGLDDRYDIPDCLK
jgi:hypothetical protein